MSDPTGPVCRHAGNPDTCPECAVERPVCDHANGVCSHWDGTSHGFRLSAAAEAPYRYQPTPVPIPEEQP